MSLVSNEFLLLVLAAVLVYYLAPKRIQWLVLLVFSYAYYLAGSVRYVVLLLFSTTVSYGMALLIEYLRAREVPASTLKKMAALGVVLNLGMLGAVKYTGWWKIFPLGISFYTFQSTGYLLDVYWKRAKAERSFLKYALFVSFFPQLLQGPIGRFQRLAPQLFAPHAFDLHNLSYGVQRMIWGFAKKMIIADWAGVFADAIWADLDRYNGLALFGLLFYGIQLYADFSGAMDVVIGIGNLFGITMDENFRRPYLATSMANFWKRWHITLGEWMMDYVFYPVSLSGWMSKFSKWAKKKFGRKQGRVVPIALADLIVFFLVGIWHGASWKYVMYGLLNGGIIAFSELMADPYRKMRKALHIKGDEGWYHAFAVVRTFILVNLRWFFDRSDTVSQGCYMIRQAVTHFAPSQLFDIAAGSGGTAFVPWALLIIAVGCIVMVTVGVLQEKGYAIRDGLARLPIPVSAGIYLLLLVLIGMFGSTAAPRGFLYAQF